MLRIATATALGALAMITLGAGVVLLLLWRQDRTSGVLSTQVERAWDLVDLLRGFELLIAVAVVPVAMAWAALATLNVRRATARRCNPVFAALSVPVAVGAVWAAGAAVVAPADDWPAATGGLILQATALALPVLVLERVARAAEGPRRPLRATYVAAVAYVAHLQGLGGLSTIERTDDPEPWGRLSAYLIMAALIQVFGAIAANEACRSIEGASQHRYELRRKFGESVLLQAQH
jgi:hypothetical protein